MQITGPPPSRQQVLQSTCQHWLPFAEAGGEEINAAIPVQMTAANTTTAAHFTFFVIVHLRGAKATTPARRSENAFSSGSRKAPISSSVSS